MRTILLATFISILFFSCKRYYKTYDNKHYQNTTLPGIIKLSNGLMIDETEITNFHWCEYMYWTSITFGKNSPEYQATIPDTNCWIKTDTSLLTFTQHYLFHPAFRIYPVVGITQKQAESFSKWRSDRVMEYILVSSGILKWQADRNSENYFTIEKYFKGEYLGIKPDSNHLYYPDYTLISVNEWKKASKHYDSLLNSKFNNLQSNKNKKAESHFNYIHCGYAGVNYKKNSYSNISYTIPAYSGFPPYNLKGNVSEWTKSTDTTIGGGWYHTRAEILNDTIFICKSSNAWTGFRCVANWKKWNK
jgi:hypothetical protein